MIRPWMYVVLGCFMAFLVGLVWWFDGSVWAALFALSWLVFLKLAIRTHRKNTEIQNTW